MSNHNTTSDNSAQEKSFDLNKDYDTLKNEGTICQFKFDKHKTQKELCATHNHAILKFKYGVEVDNY